MLTRPDPTCAEVRRELAAVALGETPAADAVLVRRHLAGCASCAGEGAEVLRLVGGLRTGASPRQSGWPLRAACAAALAALLIVTAIVPSRGRPASSLPTDPVRAPAVAGLLAAQAHDGAWREDPRDGSSLFTVGLSGLATVGCLRAGPADAAAADAARRGCDFLVAALASHDPAADASPELSLRAQAAAAWALGVAATRWPERYRDDAIVAIRRLGRLRDVWDPRGPADVTAALVSNAYRAASAIGVAGSAAASGARPALVAVRFEQPSAPGTRLAEQALAAAGPF